MFSEIMDTYLAEPGKAHPLPVSVLVCYIFNIISVCPMTQTSYHPVNIPKHMEQAVAEVVSSSGSVKVLLVFLWPRILLFGQAGGLGGVYGWL